MSIDQLANQDFEHAFSRAFWRKVFARLKGEKNDLLPFDEIREHLPIRGQHYIGLRQVEIDKVVGSLGRYRDFDRAFLPLQKKTRDRWININKAHYNQIPLPPVELFKIGDIYFVKDGNHRVSVARERGQDFIDAYVIEIDIPMKLAPNIRLDEIGLKKEYGEFLLQTRLNELQPEAQLELTTPGLYPVLLEHIEVHRWYLGQERSAEVPYPEAVTSWFDNVYTPLVETIREQGLDKTFAGQTETDLYLWIMVYQGYLRQAVESEQADDNPRAEAAKQLVENYPLPAVKQLINLLNRTKWLDALILNQEQASFLEKTRLAEIRPGAEIRLTLLGQYNKLLEHIGVHRWYLGEQRGTDVSYEEAVGSWYDHVYLPLIEIIREQGVMKEFPERTESDLYLWTIQHLWFLREGFEDVPMEKAVEHFAEDYSERPAKKVAKVIKKATGFKP